MKPDYINFQEGEILNKDSLSLSICKIEEDHFFWVFFENGNPMRYQSCTSIENAETFAFEYAGNCGVYMDTHQAAENYYNHLLAEKQRQKEFSEKLQNEREQHIKEKAKALYLNALLIVPGITLDQCEALLKAANENEPVFPSAEDDLPF